MTAGLLVSLVQCCLILSVSFHLRVFVSVYQAVYADGPCWSWQLIFVLCMSVFKAIRTDHQRNLLVTAAGSHRGSTVNSSSSSTSTGQLASYQSQSQAGFWLSTSQLTCFWYD